MITDAFLIEMLQVVAKSIAIEAEQRAGYGGFGNSYGQKEVKKLLLAASDMLRIIAESI